MTKNEIKKLLYKNKPIATLRLEDNDRSIYAAEIGNQEFVFSIPKEELYNEDGKKIFADIMESQLLIRWLV